MEKGDHCLGACYRVGNIYVISTARDNTKIFAWSTLLSSLERFLGLKPLSSERGVASVGDPTNRDEHLGDSVVTSNALSRPLVQRKLRRKQRRRAQRGNEREKMWFNCNVINFI